VQNFLGGDYQALYLDASQDKFPHYVAVRATPRGELIVEVVTVFKKEHDNRAADSIVFGRLNSEENKYKAFIYARCVTK